MTDIWDEKPESKVVGFELNEYDDKGDPLCATVHHYDVEEMDAWLDELETLWKTMFQAIRSCEEQGYISITPKLITVICGYKVKADALEFLFGEKGIKMENLMKLQIWRTKAKQWDKLQSDYSPVEIGVFDVAKELNNYQKKLEAIKDWINKKPKCIRGSLELKELEKLLEGESVEV